MAILHSYPHLLLPPVACLALLWCLSLPLPALHVRECNNLPGVGLNAHRSVHITLALTKRVQSCTLQSGYFAGGFFPVSHTSLALMFICSWYGTGQSFIWNTPLGRFNKTRKTGIELDTLASCVWWWSNGTNIIPQTDQWRVWCRSTHKANKPSGCVSSSECRTNS
jgi:hypothetical protein